MPAPKVVVSRRGAEFFVRVRDRGGLSESEILQRFTKVFEAANAAAQLPGQQRSGDQYRSLYNEGPLLFNEVVIEPVTKQSRQQLGGMQGKSGRLGATVSALRAQGFEVEESP